MNVPTGSLSNSTIEEHDQSSKMVLYPEDGKLKDPEGVTYTSCTDKDSETGTPWCATGVDTDGYVVDDDWGECKVTSQAEQEQTTQSSSWFAWLG